MENLFTTSVLQSPSFFQRLLKKIPQENAYLEVKNLLATKALRDIKIEDIEKIAAKYKVDLHDKFLDQFKGLYESYLKKCFEDNVLTDEEIEELNYLRHLLILKEYDISELHDKLGGEIYKKTYDNSLAQGELHRSKEEFLDKLKRNLRLPDSLASKISLESRNNLLNSQLGKIVEDGRISPEEWEELNAVAKNLNIELTIEDGTKAQLEKMKLYWLIENAEIPVKSVDINLQKSEQCYYTSRIDWLENRTITQRINYGGPSYRVKIMKGVYYRAGSVKVKRITAEQLLLIDSGTIYITNKRLIFLGSKKNTNIPITKILSITPYSDGVGIEKDSGKSPIFRLTDNADIFALILGRVINDLQAE